MSQDFQPLFETTPYFNSQMLNNIPMINGNNTNNNNSGTDNTATTTINTNTNTNTGNNNPPNVNETIDLLSFPETTHLSDEIFFNNYQFNSQLGSESNYNSLLSQQQQQQQQQQFLYNQQPQPQSYQQDQRINQINSATSAHSFDNELASNISSNSLNTYFSNPNASSSASSSSSSSSFSSGSTNNNNGNGNTGNNNNNNNNNQATSKVPTTPQQFIHHGRQNSTSIPIDQLTLLSLRTPGTTKPINNQLIPQNQFNNLQQPNFDSYSPTSQPSLQSQNPNQLKQGFQPISSTNSALVNNVSVDANTIAAAVAAATAATEDITAGPVLEEGTINPRQLFNNKLGTSMSSPSLSTLFVNNRSQQQPPQQQQNIQSLPTSAIPPDQQSIQQLAMLQLQQQQQQQQVPVSHKRSSSTPHFDFKINDDFTNSISTWFNNQNGFDPNQIEEEENNNNNNNKLFVNPNGILKPHTKSRNHSYSSGVMHSSRGTSRRNSVQLLNNNNNGNTNGNGNGNGGNNVVTTITNGLTTNSLHGSPITLTTAHFENINEENDSINDTSIDINNIGITTKSKSITTSVDGDGDGDAKHSRKRRKSSSAINMGESSIGPLSDSPSISPTNSNTNNGTTTGTTAATTTATKNFTKEESMKKKSTSTSTNTGTTTTKNERKKSSTNTHNNVSPNGSNNNSQASFSCNECDKQFKRSEHLKRHQRSVHSNDRPFACKYCEKKFSRSDNLAQHLKTHSKIDSNGNSIIVYGNPSNHGRKDKKKSV
ncbi:transcription factor, putative [Candida dubliniensis CD36]|uniref:Transcription factor, putative n=1 Tax=Candida dubliniensis (strain CD36 / ATCC MYA-646 / CBS 7987 / NCPF 3949 / NRRL Y-17841) TaxID=573826 RepID=B9W8R9_CANDC|nr:transcription factor, putative [Candida dubliniensis CD36]CAX45142.1 transcription factor, putative [Candida dubliniensis CD36]